MRCQIFSALTVLCGFTCMITAIPTVKNSGIIESCDVTTVFVTVAPTSSTATLAQLSITPVVDYGGVAMSRSSALGLVSRTDSTATAHLTSTFHETVFFTSTMTGGRTTRTETTELTQLASTSTLAQHTLPLYPTPIESVKTQQTCPGYLVTCPETPTSMSLFVSRTADIASIPLTGSTSTRPVVYVFETLTVIPLSALPTTSSSIDQKTTLVIRTTVLSTIKVILTHLASPTSVTTRIVYSVGQSNTDLLSSSSSGSHPSIGASGWNRSISVGMSTPSPASFGAGIYTTLATGAVTTSTTTSYSSPSINFSNSYLLPNVTSALIAQSGFTASPLSSASPITVGELPSELISVTSASTIAPTAEVPWTESCTEIGPSNSAFESLRSTAKRYNATSGFTTLSTLYSSTLVLPSSTTSPILISSTLLSPSAEDTSKVSSVRSTSSGFSTSTLSSPSSVYVATPTSQISLHSSSISASTTTTTTTTTSTSTKPLNKSSASSVSSDASSEGSSPVTIPSGLSTSTASTSLTSEFHASSSSLISTNASSESTTVAPTAFSPSLLPTTASSRSLTVQSSINSMNPASSTLTSPTTTSSILTLTTLTNSVSLASSSTSSNSLATLNVTTASSISSLPPKPTGCGEHGDFTLNFDDLPPLSVKDNSTADPMPLFSPYHQFYFSNGWTIVPPPTDPYRPSSGRLLVEFLANPKSALGYTGALGNGENALLGCFNFNTLGMSLGCDSTGPDCDWQFTGLRYNNITKGTDTITTQTMSTAACPLLSNCDLVPVVLDSTFINLTELRINVTVAGVDKIWWLDDLKFSWFDDSCDSGLCRQEHI